MPPQAIQAAEAAKKAAANAPPAEAAQEQSPLQMRRSGQLQCNKKNTARRATGLESHPRSQRLADYAT